MKGAGAFLFALLASGCQASMVDNPQAAALNLELGASYLSQGRLELARDKLTRATRQDPGSSEAHRVLGMVFESLNDAARAENHYRRAVRLAPRDVEALNSLGVFQCLQTGNPSQGLEVLKRAAREASDARRVEVYTNCGLCELPQDSANARRWFRLALELDPRHEPARLFLESLGAHN